MVLIMTIFQWKKKMIEINITEDIIEKASLKICTKCKIEKLKTEFGNKGSGLFSQCKLCTYNYLKEYRIKNPEKVKNYPSNNKELTLKRVNDWKLNNLEKFKSNQKAYREKYKEKRNIQSSEYHYKNKKRLNKASREYAKNNRSKVYNKQKEWKENNKEHVNQYYRKYQANKLKTDKTFRLNKCMSSQIKRALGKNKKTNSWTNLVNFTPSELKEHLESKFTKGMTWENRGKNGWEIDHVIPISLFKFDSYDHPAFKACWELSNLQPLWATTKIAMKYGETKDYKGNIEKGNKIKITRKIENLLNKVNI